tara:strand:- start:3655 stop:3990 length:336 start_codon:yes stop_codon:yes gene_type:complete
LTDFGQFKEYVWNIPILDTKKQDTMQLIVGQYFTNIKCESFLDKQTNRIRVRPLENQQVPSTVFIECLKKIREENKVVTSIRDYRSRLGILKKYLDQKGLLQRNILDIDKK